MPAPPAPPRPSGSSPPGAASWFGLGLVASAVATLAMVTAVLVPWLLLVVGLLLAFIGLQYMLWGWWLGAVIRREEAETDSAEESRQDG